MISTVVACTSAVLLRAAAFPLLFASDVIRPRIIPGLPLASSWLGKRPDAGWLSVALFNWNARHAVLGGIYGRPSLNLNLVVYVVSGLALLKASDATLAVRVTAVPFVAMAAVYGVLLSRGPLDRPVDR